VPEWNVYLLLPKGKTTASKVGVIVRYDGKGITNSNTIIKFSIGMNYADCCIIKFV
jgi:hypothetical protein